ncbi:MAG TPA: FAD-linked oxidase C-terminal domain-containing protein [Bacteroidia bacterium]|nr:FAD-linked oxidase C-terminal domain-containing protein [Bacteroidia bacterium]
MNSTYTKIEKRHAEAFADICGNANVLVAGAIPDHYGRDYTEDLKFDPEVVVKPGSTEEVSRILAFCNKENIPVTPRGAGTGLSGGALPVYGGVVLSTERLNKIIDIDTANLQATVQPGVINQVFRDAVEAQGLFYPPDPASRGSCFLGGNLAECAGGPKAVKYGVTRDYVLNTEIVLPSGEIMMTGANVLKNSTGYNLTQLLIGSEGTLGVITKIIFRLLPKPKHDLLLLVPFASSEAACAAVSAVFRSGIIPSAMEFMERDALDYAMQFVETTLQVADNVAAHLIIEVDGNDQDALFRDCEKITEVVTEFGCLDVLFADSAAQKAELWKLRRAVGEAVKAHSIYKEEDTVVPRAALPELLKGVKETGRKYGFRTVCYGHAGDGNLHVNILRDEMSETDWNTHVPEGIREIFKLCVQLGGTLSGEHGIGYVQKNYMDIPFGPAAIALQKGIKKVFDPNNILNPSKMFP